MVMQFDNGTEHEK